MLGPAREILEIDHVIGVVLLNIHGAIEFKEFIVPGLDEPGERAAFFTALEAYDWAPFVSVMDGLKEADFIFEKKRLYVRTVDGGILIVVMSSFASPSMVKLKCDLAADAIKKGKNGTGLGRFFKLGPKGFVL